MILISLSSLALAIGCYTISQLQIHGKLRWMKERSLVRGFWDDDSYLRKYKLTPESTVIKAPDNWYYRFFKIKYKERFPLSATFLSNLTDGYHMCQSLSFIFLSLSFSIATGLNFFLIWGGVLLVHFGVYRLLQK